MVRINCPGFVIVGFMFGQMIFMQGEGGDDDIHISEREEGEKKNYKEG